MPTGSPIPCDGCAGGLCSPYTFDDGSYNPLGGYCLGDIKNMPTYGGDPSGPFFGQPAIFAPQGGGLQPASYFLGGPSVYSSSASSPPPGLPAGSGPGAPAMPTGMNVISQLPQLYPTDPLTTPGGPTNPATSGTSLGGALCDLITNATYRALCKAGVSTFMPSTGQTSSCPVGYEPDGRGGCKIKGLGTYLPGDIGKPDYTWQPVRGMFGAGFSPTPVARTVRVCPADFVLGKDGVCYDHLPRTKRAHNPGAKPLFTGGDMNALRRAKALKRKARKMASFFPKPARASAPRRRK